MRTIAAIAIVLFGASSAVPAVRRAVTPEALATAINNADAELVPYRKTKVSPANVREVRCIAPDEEPTEFECKWEEHTQGGWIKRTTWLTIDGNGWRVMDA